MPVIADREASAMRLREAVEGDPRFLMFRRSRRLGSIALTLAFALTGWPEAIAAAGGVTDSLGVVVVLTVFWLFVTMILRVLEFLLRLRIGRDHAAG